MQDASPVSLSHLTKGLVGIESRVHEVIRILNIESSEVRFTGICGMRGIGKTTLAKVVFESIRNTFQGSSFIEFWKDISSNDLRYLQQKILRDVLKDESIKVTSFIHGQTLLKTKLRDLKVLIVLDVANLDDWFMYLAGGREWFGPGSRIIVTTTDAGLLDAPKVNDIFMCEELKDEEALRLFCLKAFQDENPPHGFEEVSNGFVKAARGLPVALTEYGKMLCGKKKEYWYDKLAKILSYAYKRRYDVFLSFQGKDTRAGFTSHLYEALTRKHVKTFLDDRSLNAGGFIAPAPELLRAIETSRFAIVVLSSSFATSIWRLEEVTKIVDCMEQLKLTIIPVFYHVTPSDVRHQRNCFEQGFANHEANPYITPQEVATWRTAFSKVGNIKGLDVTPHRNESEIVSEILRTILQDMQDPSPWQQFLHNYSLFD